MGGKVIDLIKAAWSATQASPWRLALVLAIAVTCAGFVKWYSDRQYDAGYQAARSEALSHVITAEAEAAKAARADLDRTLAERTLERDRARALVDELRNRPPEVEVHEVIQAVRESGECERIGPEPLRLLNLAAGDAPSAQ